VKIQLKKDCTYALVAPTSMGIRITPFNGQPVHASDLFSMQATSAESNVASVASYLGLPVKILTTFVKGSPIAQIIKDNLKSRHMDYEGPEVEQGNPWGYRHQINIADAGFGPRGPRVWNDRAGEVGRTLDVKDFDLDRILGAEGVQMVHLSGLIAALSPQTGRFCLELARAAKKHGTRISFDLNYRATFWKGREKELSAIFGEIAGLSDVLVGNEEDFQLCLGVKGPQAGGKGVAAEIDAFKIHPPAAKVVLDDLRDGAAFDEGREDLHRQAEIRADAGDVGFGAGDLHDKGPADLHRLPRRRRDADAHARRDDQGVLAVLLQFKAHSPSRL
jgi:2-dehydro-3-deoxygluconokinase